MKTIALLLALFLASACASSSDGFATKVETCEPGGEIGISAGLAEPEMVMGGRFTGLVEVFNNSGREFTVSQVRIDPASRMNETRYTIEGGTREFEREIADGDTYTFEIPLNIRMVDAMDRMPRGSNVPFEASVSVKLADGTTARCRFALRARF